MRERLSLLVDLIDAQRKMIEVADHKARFALVIMGGANAALLLLSLRGGLMDRLPDAMRPWLLLALLPYGGVTLAFLLEAARVLQPHLRMWPEVVAGTLRPLEEAGAAGGDERPLGLIYWGAAQCTDFAHYSRLWTQARVGQVTAELTLVAHELAQVNADQYASLRRLFRGLRIMLAMTAALVVGTAALALR